MAVVEPRSRIVDTGILIVLESIQKQQPSDALTPVKIEFLQASIYAGQYVWAEQQIVGQWPIPTNTCKSTIQQVLRYFYLRACLHIGCRNWIMAVRCLWTCLSIPTAESHTVVSAIAVAAWKKLMLVQCILADSLEIVESTPNAANKIDRQSFGGTPREMPTSLSRYLSSNIMESGSRRDTILPTATSAPEDQHVIDMVETEDSQGNNADAENESIKHTKVNNNDDDDDDAKLLFGVHVYRELVKAFSSVDRSSFDAIVQRHKNIFVLDGNWGMIQHGVTTVMLRRQVYALSIVYASIPLSQFVSDELYGYVSSEKEARILLEELSIDWPVRVDDDTYVVFPPAKMTSTSQAGEILPESMKELVHLTKKIRELDFAQATSPKYLAILRKTGAGLKVDKSVGPRGVEEI